MSRRTRVRRPRPARRPNTQRFCRSDIHKPGRTSGEPWPMLPATVVGTVTVPVGDDAEPRAIFCVRCANALDAIGWFVPDDPSLLAQADA